MTPTEEWLRATLGRAILDTCTDDEVLLHRDASERSVVFRIGRYLAPVVEMRWPGKLWVDLEYNRLAGEAKIAKAVAGLLDPRADDRLEQVAARKRSVLPDLIVHDRNGRTRDHNILVVEAKKSPAGHKAVQFDLQKLHAYKQQLDYQHAVYLELIKGRPPVAVDRHRRRTGGDPSNGLGTSSSAQYRSRSWLDLAQCSEALPLRRATAARRT